MHVLLLSSLSVSKHFVASLCSQKSVDELMALWFESETRFDIPDTSGLHQISELNRSEEVTSLIYLRRFLLCIDQIGAALKSRSFSSSGQKNVD